MDGPASCQELPSPRRNLQDSATCHPRFLGSSARVLRPKPAKPSTGSFGLNYRTPSFAAQTRKPSRMVLRPKPPNHSTRATLSSPGRTPSPLCLRSTRASTVLTRSTRSTSMSSHTCRCQVPTTAASLPALWSMCPSLVSALHCSQSIGTTHLYLTFTSALTTSSELNT